MVRILTHEVQDFEKTHLAMLRALAPECMVLLKRTGDFPLSAPRKVALYGSGARETIKVGTGSGGVNVRHYATVEEGLENVGFTVTTKAWRGGCKASKENAGKQSVDNIMVQAIKADNDMIMPGGTEDIDGILAGLSNDEITREDLEICAGRVLALAKRIS